MIIGIVLVLFDFHQRRYPADSITLITCQDFTSSKSDTEVRSGLPSQRTRRLVLLSPASAPPSLLFTLLVAGNLLARDYCGATESSSRRSSVRRCRRRGLYVSGAVFVLVASESVVSVVRPGRGRWATLAVCRRRHSCVRRGVSRWLLGSVVVRLYLRSVCMIKTPHSPRTEEE